MRFLKEIEMITSGIQASFRRSLFKPSRSKRGLLLMPGGAKGAYQAGALLRLAEAGIVFDCVIGSSIGALNGAYYVQGDGSTEHMKRLCSLWLETSSKFYTAVSIGALTKLVEYLGKGLSSITSFIENILTGRDSLFGSFPVAALVDSVIDYHRVVVSEKELFIGVMEEWGPIFDTLLAPFREAIFVSSAGLRPEELRKLLLASAAIPFVFSSHEVFGRKCRDGGWARFDLTPIVISKRIKSLFSIELSRERLAPVVISAPYSVELVRITPSLPIDDGGFFSTFDFSSDNILKLIELGYKDAGEVLSGKFSVSKIT